MSSGAHFDVLSGRLAIDVSRIQPALQSVAPKLEAFNANARRAFEQLQAGVNNVGKALVALGTSVAAASVKLIDLASDANEAASKFSFVFGKAAEETGKKLDEFSKAAGRSRYAMRDMAANIGALIGPMGFTRKKTGELSSTFAKLAVDLSSFFNVTEEDALQALKSGIVGESEPLRRFGVQLNEAKIQAEAFKLGLAKTKEQVQGAVKAQAILSIVLRETKQAQGDAIRTGDQFANSLRRMNDFIKDSATDLGMALIPAATRFVRAVGDMAEPVKNWAKANQEVLSQRIDGVMGLAGDAALRIVKAFQSAWQATQRLSHAFRGASEKAGELLARLREMWNGLPRGAQDMILVSMSLMAASRGLEFFGSRIPFVGEFAVALSKVVNPLTLIKGLIAFLGPALATVFSPAGAAIAAVIAVVYGLVKSFQKAYAESEEFRATWERVKDKLASIWKAIKRGFGEAMDWVGQKISDLTGGAFKSLGDVGQGVAEGLLDGFERLLDWFEGDGKGLQSIGLSIAKSWNGAMASILESIATVIDKASEMFYGPIGKLLAKADPEFAKLYMHYARGNTGSMSQGLRDAATGLRFSNAAIDQQQQEIEAKRNEEKKARDQKIKDKKANDNFIDQMRQGPQGNEAYEQIFGDHFGEEMAAGEVKYKKSHASEVAQEEEQVGQAANAQAGAYDVNLKAEKETSPSFVGGNNRANLSQVAANARAMGTLARTAGQRGIVLSAGSGASSLAQQVTQFGQSVAAMYANFANLSSEQQGLAVSLQKTYQDLVAQFKAGKLTQQQFNEEVKKAADQAQKLANAEKELTDQEVAALNAKGILTPKQKEAQQAAMQQAAEQIKGQLQGAAQQMAQQAGDMYKQGQDAYQQAIDQLDQQIGDALKSGNPQQFQAAVDTLKGYAQAQIQQTLLNVANSGVDVNRTSFGSIERQGAGAGVPWNQLLSQNPQAAATIKLFESILAHLNNMKIPRMADGGVVTSPTYAMVGERGPEAVIPLQYLANWFGNPASIFTGRLGNLMNRFRINPGGMALNPLGLNAGNLGAFDRFFGNASRILNQQLDLGNSGAQGLLDRWSQVQQRAEDSLGLIRQRRQINLGGNAGWSGGAADENVGGHTHLNFQFGHIMLANATDQQIGSLFDRMEQEALRRGYSMSSNRRNALGSYTANGRGSPLQPAGQPK